MKNFSFKRSLRVAKWDLTINRAFYIKSALLIICGMHYLVIYDILCSLARYIFGLRQPSYFNPENLMTFSASMFVFIFPFLLGYTFHNLKKKLGRIQELTLPATNGEKFVAHLLIVAGGSWLVAISSHGVMDVLQYLVYGLTIGWSDTHFCIPHYFREVLSGGNMTAELKFFFYSLSCAHCSCFVLGNSIKYKYNVVWVSVIYLVLFMIFGSLVSNLITVFDLGDLINADVTCAAILAGSLFILMACFLLWLSFRFYQRAQITSRLNR